jgi:hypothetical protein
MAWAGKIQRLLEGKAQHFSMGKTQQLLVGKYNIYSGRKTIV